MPLKRCRRAKLQNGSTLSLIQGEKCFLKYEAAFKKIEAGNTPDEVKELAWQKFSRLTPLRGVNVEKTADGKSSKLKPFIFSAPHSEGFKPDATSENSAFTLNNE